MEKWALTHASDNLPEEAKVSGFPFWSAVHMGRQLYPPTLPLSKLTQSQLPWYSLLPIPKETLLHPYLSLSPTWTGNGNWDTNSSPQNSCKNNKSITKLPVPACARVWILIDGFVSNCKCHGVAPAAHISTASRITRHKRKCKSHCGDEKNEITTIICSAERQRV